MKNNHVSVRFPPGLALKLDACANRFNTSNPQTLIILCEEFLAVLESGIYGTPIYDRLKAQWDADLKEVQNQINQLSTRVAPRPKTKAA